MKAIAEAVTTLLTDDALRMQLGRNAAEDAQRRFDLNRQVEDYIGWYREILEDWQPVRKRKQKVYGFKAKGVRSQQLTLM